MSGGRLVVLDRLGRDVKRYSLPSGLVTLGSNPDCDIRVMLPTVSEHHAVVVVRANQTVIRNVSDGRTLVNGQPVSVTGLQHGDTITLGDRSLRWEYDQPEAVKAVANQALYVKKGKGKTRSKARASEGASRRVDPSVQLVLEMNHRASMPAKQVAIVQPQRRDHDYTDTTPRLIVKPHRPYAHSNKRQRLSKTDSPKPSPPLDKGEAKRKTPTPRVSPKADLSNTTKATLWIESRKSAPRKSPTAVTPKAPALSPRRGTAGPRATPLRTVVLRKSMAPNLKYTGAQTPKKTPVARVAKIQAPLELDPTKQAALMLMTGRTPKSSLATTPSPSYLVKRPSPVRKTPQSAKKTPLSAKKTPASAKKSPKSNKKTPLSAQGGRQSRRSVRSQEAKSDDDTPRRLSGYEQQKSTRSSRGSTGKSMTILEISDTDLGPRSRRSGNASHLRSSLSSPTLPSPRKSALKDPTAKNTSRKNESIKFDLSNLENFNDQSDVLILSHTTRGQLSDRSDSEEDLTLHYSDSSPPNSPSPRRSIHSRSSRMLERSIGTPMETNNYTRTLTPQSPSGRKSLRGSLMVQKALESPGNESGYSRRTTKSLDATRTLSRSPRSKLEVYSIVDLVSMDSSESRSSEYNSARSTRTTFATPDNRRRKTRSTIEPSLLLGSSTPFLRISRLENRASNSVGKKSAQSKRSQSLSTPKATKLSVSSKRSSSLSTPENTKQPLLVNSTRVSRISRRTANDSDLLIISGDEDSPKTSKRNSRSLHKSIDMTATSRNTSKSSPNASTRSFSSQSSNSPDISRKSVMSPNTSKQSPKPANITRQSTRSNADTSRLSLKSPNASRLSPKSPNASRLSPKSPNASRLSPMSPNASGLSPKSQNASRSSPKSPNASRFSPKTPNASGLSGNSPNASKFSLKSPNATRLSTKSTNASKMSLKSANTTRQSTRSNANASRLSPKSPNISRLSPKSPNISRLSPKSPNASKLSLKFANTTRQSTRSNANASVLSPKSPNASKLSLKSANNSRQSPKLPNTSKLSPKSNTSRKSARNLTLTIGPSGDGLHTPENRNSPEEVGTPVLSIQSLLDSSHSSLFSQVSTKRGRLSVKPNRKTIGGLRSQPKRGRPSSKSKSFHLGAARKSLLRRSNDSSEVSDKTDEGAPKTSNDENITPKSTVKLVQEAVKNKHSTAKKPQSKRSIIDNLNESDFVKSLFNSPVKRKLSQSMTEFSRTQLFDDEPAPTKRTRKTTALTGRSLEQSFLDRSENITPEFFVSPMSTPENSPNVKGIRKSFRKNTPQNLSAVRGVKQLSRGRKSVKNDLTNVAGVKNLFAKSPNNSLTNVRGVKELFRSSPRNDLRRVTGVTSLFQTRGKAKSPKNDLTNVHGVKKLYQKKSPENDLRNVSGVKKGLTLRSPKNDLTDVRGVKQLFRREKSRSGLDLSGVEELFNTSANSDGNSRHDATMSESLFDQAFGKPKVKATYARSFTAKSAQRGKNERSNKSLNVSFDLLTNSDSWLEREIQKRKKPASPKAQNKSLNKSQGRELQKLLTDTVNGTEPLQKSRTRVSTFIKSIPDIIEPRKVSSIYEKSLPIKKRSFVDTSLEKSANSSKIILPIKKRAPVHSTPVKARWNMTVNASELGRVSPIAAEKTGIEADTTIRATRLPPSPRPAPASPKATRATKSIAKGTPKSPVQKKSTRASKAQKTPAKSPKATRGRKTSAALEITNTKRVRGSLVITLKSPKPNPLAQSPNASTKSPKSPRVVAKKAPKSPKAAPTSPMVGVKSTKVAAKSPKAATKSPKQAVKSPNAAAKSPNAAAKSPKIASKSPKGLAKSPKVAVKSPKVATKSPKVAAKSPKVAAKSPKAANKSPKSPRAVAKKPPKTSKAAPKSPKVAASSPISSPRVVAKKAPKSPKAAPRSPKVVAKSPKVMVKSPKSKRAVAKKALPSPKATLKSPKAATKSPKVAAKSPAVAKKAPKSPKAVPKSPKVAAKSPKSTRALAKKALQPPKASPKAKPPRAVAKKAPKSPKAAPKSPKAVAKSPAPKSPKRSRAAAKTAPKSPKPAARSTRAAPKSPKLASPKQARKTRKTKVPSPSPKKPRATRNRVTEEKPATPRTKRGRISKNATLIVAKPSPQLKPQKKTVNFSLDIEPKGRRGRRTTEKSSPVKSAPKRGRNKVESQPEPAAKTARGKPAKVESPRPVKRGRKAQETTPKESPVKPKRGRSIAEASVSIVEPSKGRKRRGATLDVEIPAKAPRRGKAAEIETKLTRGSRAPVEVSKTDSSSNNAQNKAQKNRKTEVAEKKIGRQKEVEVKPTRGRKTQSAAGNTKGRKRKSEEVSMSSSRGSLKTEPAPRKSRKTAAQRPSPAQPSPGQARTTRRQDNAAKASTSTSTRSRRK